MSPTRCCSWPPTWLGPLPASAWTSTAANTTTDRDHTHEALAGALRAGVQTTFNIPRTAQDTARPPFGHPRSVIPVRCVGLGDVDVDGAALSEVKELGLQGVELRTNVNGVSIADPSFRDVFVEADRLGLSVFLHAFQPPAGGAIMGPAASAVHFPLGIALAVAGLIAGGTLEACPTLRLCASHGGGGLGLALPRLAHTWRTKEALRARLPTPPEVTARRLFYDILLFDPHALRYLLDFVGPTQVVVGSDYPFLDVPPQWPLSELDLPDATRHAIRETNARAFLGL